MDYFIKTGGWTQEEIETNQKKFNDFKSQLSKYIDVENYEDIYALWFMYCSGYSIEQVAERA